MLASLPSPPTLRELGLQRREVVSGPGHRSERDRMSRKKLTAFAVAVCAVLGVSSAAMAAAPARVTVKSRTSVKFKPNRYIQDGLRWNKDSYTVASGGTVHVVNGDGSEGPHTFTVLAKRDVPKTIRTLFSCRACAQLTRAHGADPNTEAPPRFPFLENGVGQTTPPSLDRPGDSGVTGRGRKGESIDFHVTARAGTTLYFICLIHPWMQSKIEVE
jgi:plastocyanin